MAIQQIKRNIAGFAQTQAVATPTAAAIILSDWTSANDWVAIIELTITGRGTSFTGGNHLANTYYRREVFKWNISAAAPQYVGVLVDPTILEENVAWNAVIAINGNNLEVQMAGVSTEIVDWSWYGTINMQRVT
jgi:hypothetical protein